MKELYEHYGYHVVDIPTGTVEYRKNFVLNQINNRASNP